MKPHNGVCLVKDIVHPDLPNVDKDRLYYLLTPINNNRSKLYVPIDDDSHGMRKALTAKEAKAVIDNIPSVEAAWIANDKMREQTYKDALQSCDPNALVSIIKNLYLRRKKRYEQGKKSTATDERYFKMAEDALYAELAFALGKEKGEMRQFISMTIERKKNVAKKASVAAAT